jgi:hypothetical protein
VITVLREARMNKRKRQRLEARGWRVGSAEEFLGLTAEEATLVALRLELCKLAKELRISRGLTQTALANCMKSSQSRVAKLEACDSSISLDLVFRDLVCLQASSGELTRAFARAEGFQRAKDPLYA